jgi:hypothetical protein
LFSVTEREVINGLLKVRNTKNHVLAYVRYINNINLQNLRRAGLFIDIANRALDAEAVRLLANLRDERMPAKIEPSNLMRYNFDKTKLDECLMEISITIIITDTRWSGLAVMDWQMTPTTSTFRISFLIFTETLRG